jgi:hypothetical protein
MKISLLIPPIVIKVIRIACWYYNKEKKYHDSNVSFTEKLWLWKNGFFSAHKSMYRLNRRNIKSYLSTKDYKKLHPINGKFSSLIDNKSFLPLIINKTNNLNIAFDAGLERSRIGLEEGDILKKISEYILSQEGRDIIVKPVNGSGGNGFQILNLDNYQKIINYKIRNKHSFLIQEKIEQQEYANRIFPYSLNTIRVVLFRDANSRSIKLAGAVHRFGTSESQPVDNAGKGGLFSYINSFSGELGKSYVYKGKKFEGYHTVHPDTKMEIEGIFIPNWTKIINRIIEYFNNVRWFEFGGLDLILTDDDFIIIEINSFPDLELIQIFQPYLKNKDFYEFLLSKGLYYN